MPLSTSSKHRPPPLRWPPRRHLSPFRTSFNLPNPEGRVPVRGIHSSSTWKIRLVHAPPPLLLRTLPAAPGRAAVSRGPPLPPLPWLLRPPQAQGRFLSRPPRASPLRPCALAAPRKAGASRCLSLTPLPAPNPIPSTSPGLGEHLRSMATGELGAVARFPVPPSPRPGLRPPRPRRAPSGTWPPFPRLRSAPDTPAPRAPQLRAHPSQLPPPRTPSPGGGGHERARRRGQWALGLLWPLPRAAANRGGRWW